MSHSSLEIACLHVWLTQYENQQKVKDNLYWSSQRLPHPDLACPNDHLSSPPEAEPAEPGDARQVAQGSWGNTGMPGFWHKNHIT